MKRVFYLLACICSAHFAHAQPGMFKYDIAPAFSNSYPQYLTTFGNKVFFFANDGARGWEPWVADSVNIPANIADINSLPNTSSIAPSYYQGPSCMYDNKMYFNADNGTSGPELYVWNGVSSPTLVWDVNSGGDGSYPDNLVVLNAKIYFKGRTTTEGFELCAFTPSTFLGEVVTDINVGSDSSVTGNVIAFNNNIYFTANTPAKGTELWMYDPSLDTATLVTDINPGTASSNPQDFIIAGTKLFFSADNGAHGRELYSFNGSVAQRVTDINPGTSSSIASYGLPHMAFFNGYIYFSATDGTGSGEYHMYRHDPQSQQTVLACKTNNNGSSDTRWLTNYGGQLYFNAYDTARGFELWSYDGINNPVRIADICPGKNNGQPSQLRAIGNNLYFRANECAGIGDELFRYNYVSASVSNVSLVADINLYPNPATHTAQLEIKLKQPQELSIDVTDATGRVVWQKQSMHYSTSSQVINIPLSDVAAGNYFYRIYNNDGVYCAGGKIVKQ